MQLEDTDKLDLSFSQVLEILSNYVSDSILEQIREDLQEEQEASSVLVC